MNAKTNREGTMKTATHQTTDCGRGWGRKINPDCPRCQELQAGAPARAGWGDRTRQQETARIAAIRAHRCSPATCGPVCTRFDW